MLPKEKKSRQSRNLIATLILHIDAIFFPTHNTGMVDNFPEALLLTMATSHSSSSAGKLSTACRHLEKSLGAARLGWRGLAVVLVSFFVFFPWRLLAKGWRTRNSSCHCWNSSEANCFLTTSGTSIVTISPSTWIWGTEWLFFWKHSTLKRFEKTYLIVSKHFIQRKPPIWYFYTSDIYIQGPFNVVLLPPCLPIHTSLQWWWFGLGLQVIRWCTFSQPVLEAWVR